MQKKLSPFFRKEKLRIKGVGLKFLRTFFANTRYIAICNERILFYSNLLYKFRLNCFTNDMSRVFHSHYEIIDDIENVFEAFRWQQEKSYTYCDCKIFFQKFRELEAVETMSDWVFDR